MRKLIVCCAIIQNERGQVFMVQRPPHKKNASQWEFPGGKLEVGESLEDCIHREIHEELSIQIQLIQKLPAVYHEHSQVKIELHPFLCTSDQLSCIQLNEHVDSIWIDAKTALPISVSPADIEILQLIFPKKLQQ